MNPPGGLWLLLAVLVASSAVGLWWNSQQGKFAAIPAAESTRTSAPESLVADPAPVLAVDTGSADLRNAEPATDHQVLSAAELGVALGKRATLVQFSSAFCAPCRATRRVLSHVSELMPGVSHIEFDAESHLELVRRLHVRSTPTTLVLDSHGVIVRRAGGQPRTADVVAALGELL